MARREVLVVEFRRRKHWQQQIAFYGGTRTATRARSYLAMFREMNPGLEARITKYVPETT